MFPRKLAPAAVSLGPEHHESIDLGRDHDGAFAVLGLDPRQIDAEDFLLAVIAREELVGHGSSPCPAVTNAVPEAAPGDRS